MKKTPLNKQERDLLISDDTFNSLLDSVQAEARKQRKALKGRELNAILNVVFHSHDHQGLDSLTLAPKFGASNEDRQQEMAKLGKMMGDRGAEVVAAYLTTEAWQSKQSTSDLDSDSYVAPSKQPDRVEILMTSGMTIDGRTGFVTDEIKGNSLAPLMYAPYRDGQKDDLSSSLFDAFYHTYTLHIGQHLLKKLRQDGKMPTDLLDKLNEALNAALNKQKDEE